MCLRGQQADQEQNMIVIWESSLVTLPATKSPQRQPLAWLPWPYIHFAYFPTLYKWNGTVYTLPNVMLKRFNHIIECGCIFCCCSYCIVFHFVNRPWPIYPLHCWRAFGGFCSRPLWPVLLRIFWYLSFYECVYTFPFGTHPGMEFLGYRVSKLSDLVGSAKFSKAVEQIYIPTKSQKVNKI